MSNEEIFDELRRISNRIERMEGNIKGVEKRLGRKLKLHLLQK